MASSIRSPPRALLQSSQIPKRTCLSILRDHGLDCIMSFSILIFASLAGIALYIDGRPADCNDLPCSFIEEMPKLGPTIFTILFGAICPQAMQSLGRFRAERGTTIGSLQMLMSVRSPFQALTNLWFVRSLTWTTVMAVLLWSCDPIAGQAALRATRKENATSVETARIRYMDTGPLAHMYTEMGTSLLYGSRASNIHDVLNRAYEGALMQGPEAKRGAEDNWGNVKIPRLKCMNTSSPTSNSAFIDTSGIQGVDCWYSLIGVPVVGLPADDASYFTLQASYIDVSCSEAKNVSEGMLSSDDWAGGLNLTYANMPIDAPVNDSNDEPESHSAARTRGFLGLDPNSPRLDTEEPTVNLVWLEGTFNETVNVSPQSPTGVNVEMQLQNRSYIGCSCTVTRQFTEAQIECDQGHCAAKTVRPVSFPHLNPNYTVFDYWGKMILQTMTAGTQRRSNNWSAAPSSTTEYFLNDSAVLPLPCRNTGNSEAEVVSLSTIPSALLSRRLSILLNTYMELWMAGSNFGRLPLPAENLTIYGPDHAPENGLLPAYIVVLLVVTVLVFCFGVAGVICALHTNAPDRFDPVVGQTYDNPSEEFRGGSAQDWKERGRKTRNVVVRLGDVKSWGKTGKVGLITGDTRPLQRGGRVYK
ncbi:hypothetical protein F5B20DRAFT_590369 [Whalleya microplaca]|nr:hypothetical protein F5B20DRAFT_590369 [Whalleya microplaca]